jgi:DMSO/TMAO reductase YedYZ molybdopterin-dependent catalytic subunit
MGARRHRKCARLPDVLDRAGVKAGVVVVRFKGLDQPVVDEAPDYMKSLDLDHARDGEVMLAFEMNGEQLPLLNGFPLRLVVPGLFDLLGQDVQRYRSAEPINLSCSAC